MVRSDFDQLTDVVWRRQQQAPVGKNYPVVVDLSYLLQFLHQGLAFVAVAEALDT